LAVDCEAKYAIVMNPAMQTAFKKRPYGFVISFFSG
jgi:hypothetical protein